MKKLILRNTPLPQMIIEFVQQHYNIITIDELNADNQDKIEVLLTSGTGKAPKALLDKLPKLKLIDIFGVGYDGIDLNECKKRNITLCNTPDVLTDDVADLAITLMLASSRRICAAYQHIVNGFWTQGHEFPLSSKVSGKKIGIVGLGRIGKAVAKRAEGFNMQIFYYSRSKKDVNYQYIDNLTLLAQEVDFLVVCAAATPDNQGMINKKVLEALGSQGILINIARGALVDENALIELIRTNKLGGCGLDVFVNEPNVSKELFNLPNVVLTPHIGSATVDTRTIMAQIVIGNLEAFRNGTDYLTKVNL